MARILFHVRVLFIDNLLRENMGRRVFSSFEAGINAGAIPPVKTRRFAERAVKLKVWKEGD